jgi:hypothetical protein
VQRCGCEREGTSVAPCTGWRNLACTRTKQLTVPAMSLVFSPNKVVTHEYISERPPRSGEENHPPKQTFSDFAPSVTLAECGEVESCIRHIVERAPTLRAASGGQRATRRFTVGEPFGRFQGPGEPVRGPALVEQGPGCSPASLRMGASLLQRGCWTNEVAVGRRGDGDTYGHGGSGATLRYLISPDEGQSLSTRKG